MLRASRSMRLFSFPTEFIQSSYPDDEQSGSDLFLTPHPLSSSLSDRQESNATAGLTGRGCANVLRWAGGVERSRLGGGSPLGKKKKNFPPPRVKSRAAFTSKGRGEVRYGFWQEPDKFLATIDVGKEDRIGLASVVSAGCACRGRKGLRAAWDQGHLCLGRDGGCQRGALRMRFSLGKGPGHCPLWWHLQGCAR